MVYMPAAVLALFPVGEIKYPDHTLQPKARRIYFTNDSKLQYTLAGEVKAAGTGNGRSHSQSKAERTEPCRITLWSVYSPHFHSAQDPRELCHSHPRSSHPNRILKSLTDTSTDQLKLDLSPFKVSPQGMLDYVKLTIKPNPTATKTPHCRLYLSSTHHSTGALFSPGMPQRGLWLHLGFFCISHCVAKGLAQWMCLRRNRSGCLGDGL